MFSSITYSPLTLQNPANFLRADTCDTQRYVAAPHPSPLKGLPGTRATDVSYRALAPGGAGICYRICTGTSESRPTANYSLLTANSTYTFSAKEKDSETGLSYFGSRYYSCDLSVWLSVDPMADKYPSTSPYAYCRNNPIILVDPNGMFDTKAEARKYRREHHTGGVVRKNYSKENNVFAGKYSIFNKRKALSYTKPSYTQDDASIPMAGLNSDGVVVSPIAHDRRTRREKFDDFEMRFTNGSVNVLQSAYIFLVSPINDVCVLIKGQDIYGTPASETDKKFSVAGLLTFGTSKYLKGVRYIKETNKYIIPEIGTSAAGLYMDIRSGYKTYQNKKNNEKKDN